MSEKQSKDVRTAEELRKKIDKGKKTDVQSLITQMATRNLLERDYKEDVLDIKFKASTQTTRIIKARKPTPEQMTTILKLNAKAILLGNRMDEKTVDAITTIYKDMAKIASELSVDKTLDETFWFKKVSTDILSNFIGELMRITQEGSVSEGELKSFR